MSAVKLKQERLGDLAHEVAWACGFGSCRPFEHVGEQALTGRGGRAPHGDQGIDEIADRIWYVIAHELAHAQSVAAEGHSLASWVRLR